MFFAFTFGPSVSCSLLHVQVLGVLDDAPELKGLDFPKTLADLERQISLFARDGCHSLRGCVSTEDGIAVRIRRPKVLDAPNPISYYPRKEFFELKVQTAAGADFKFHFLSAVSAGFSYDSVAFSACRLVRHL